MNSRVARFLVAAAAAAGLASMAACGGPATNSAASSASQQLPGMTGMTGMPTQLPVSSGPAKTATQSSTVVAPVSGNSVSIKNFAFTPASLTVKVGTTVTWTNSDSDQHTVTSKDGSFHSAPLNTGQTFTYTFSKPGSYDYLCTIHPFMTATVVVTP